MSALCTALTAQAHRAGLAQLVEHLICNQRVGSSSLSAGTTGFSLRINRRRPLNGAGMSHRDDAAGAGARGAVRQGVEAPIRRGGPPGQICGPDRARRKTRGGHRTPDPVAPTWRRRQGDRQGTDRGQGLAKTVGQERPGMTIAMAFQAITP